MKVYMDLFCYLSRLKRCRKPFPKNHLDRVVLSERVFYLLKL